MSEAAAQARGGGTAEKITSPPPRPARSPQPKPRSAHSHTSDTHRHSTPSRASPRANVQTASHISVSENREGDRPASFSLPTFRPNPRYERAMDKDMPQTTGAGAEAPKKPEEHHHYAAPEVSPSAGGKQLRHRRRPLATLTR